MFGSRGTYESDQWLVAEKKLYTTDVDGNNCYIRISCTKELIQYLHMHVYISDIVL